MKIIGLIGGMTWESTAEYYRMINETIRERLGDQENCTVPLFDTTAIYAKAAVDYALKD